VELETKHAPTFLFKLQTAAEILQDSLADKKSNSFVVLKLIFRDNGVSTRVIVLALINDLRAFKNLKQLVELTKVPMPHFILVLFHLKVQ
jgi:hypothetical protein